MNRLSLEKLGACGNIELGGMACSYKTQEDLETCVCINELALWAVLFSTRCLHT